MSQSIPYLWGIKIAEHLKSWDVYESPQAALKYLEDTENIRFEPDEQKQFFDGCKSVETDEKSGPEVTP